MGQEVLERRLERLERSNRLLGAGLLAVISMCVAVGFSQKADGIQEVVKTRELQVYSADGKLLVDVGYNSWSGGGAVAIYDKDGNRKSWWRASPNGAHLFLAGRQRSKEGEPVDFAATASIAVSDDNANVSIFGLDTTAWMSVNADKDPALEIYGKGDKPVFTTRKKQ